MKKLLLTLLFAAFVLPQAAKAQCDPGVEMCSVTIQMTDGYGDGWYDGDDLPFYIRVYQGTTLRGSVTLGSGGSGSQQVVICSGDSVRFVMDGEDFYEESSFTILNGDGTVIISGDCSDYIDGAVIVEAMPVCPSCIAVASPTVSNLTTDGFTLNWVDTLNDSPSYTIYDMSDTTIVATGIYDTYYDYSNATPATSYTFAIVANCSATDESSPVTVSVFTPCDTYDAPFVEGFEGEVACWSNEGDMAWSLGVGDYSTSTGTHGGNYNATITHTDNGNATKLVSPVIDMSGVSNGQLSFWHVQRSWAGDVDELKVYYRLSADSAWTLLADYTAAYATWTEETLTLPATSETFQVAFEMVDNWGYGVGIDDIYIGEVPTCANVTDLTASNITSNAITLIWNDSINDGASYTIYNMADTSVVATSIIDTFYTVENLDGNTSYTFLVEANCSTDDASTGVTITVRTLCAPYPLPFVETFDATLNSDPCWRGNNAALAADVFNGTALNLTTPSAWTYASSTSNGLDAGHYRVNIYGSSCKKWLITPQIDLTTATNPILSFDVAFTQYSGTSAATGYENNATQAFMVLVSTDNGQTWDSSNAVRWQNNGGQHTLASIASTAYVSQIVNLTQFVGDTVRIAFYAQSTTSGGDNNLHLDNIIVDEMPTCMPVANLAASNITDHGVTLAWNDTVNSASYTIYNMADTSVVAAGITDSFYVITNLNPNTDYTFGVEANCSGTDMSRIMTVSLRTDCGAEQLPFSADFSSTLASDPCWRGSNSVTAAAVFAGATLNLGANTDWTYTGSNRCGLPGGHYYRNVFGTGVKSWMVTPAIDLTGVANAQLSFDVALTDYNNTALPDAGGDTNNSQAFMVIISADGGNTWDSTNATVWQNAGGDYTYASLASLTYQNKVIDLSQYAGDTIKIAFYCQSLWSGGDNDLHIDNILVAGAADTTVTPATDSLTVTLAVNDATMGTTTPAPGTYTFFEGDNAIASATANSGYHFVQWMLVAGTYTDSMTNNPISMTVDSTMLGMNVTLTAIFAADSTPVGGDTTYTVTLLVNDTNMGSAMSSADEYNAGDVAVVMALSNPGYRFVNWTEGATVVSTDNPYSFTVTSDITLTANFEADSASSADSLTVITGVNDATMGTVTPAPGIHRYGLGEVYTVTATPADGYFFAGWVYTINFAGFNITDTLYDIPSTLSDTVYESDLGMTLSFTALFTADSIPSFNADSIAITYAVNDASMGTINPAPGTYYYAETDSIHVIATPFDGYQFVGWAMQSTFFGYTYDTIVYTTENVFNESLEDMGGAVITLTALFASDTVGPQPTMYTVTLSTNNATMGSVSGAGVYAEGSTVTITATPNEGYSFVGWVIDGDTITANPYTFSITGHVNAMAVFTANTGIDDAELAGVNIYGAESRIVVLGAEGKDITVYDLSGRTIACQRSAASNVEFAVAHTGVYLVKVGNASAKRVLVVR